jgi:hypothetical protein
MNIVFLHSCMIFIRIYHSHPPQHANRPDRQESSKSGLYLQEGQLRANQPVMTPQGWCFYV